MNVKMKWGNKMKKLRVKFWNHDVIYDLHSYDVEMKYGVALFHLHYADKKGSYDLREQSEIEMIGKF